MKPNEHRFSWIAGLFILSIAACSTQRSPTPSPIISPSQPQPSLTSTTKKTLKPIIPTITNTPQTDRIQSPFNYQFKVELDYSAHQLDVLEVIDYTNNTGVIINALPLVNPPGWTPETFTLTNLTMETIGMNVSSEIEPGLITLGLSRPLNPGESLKIKITYELHLPKGSKIPGYTDRQVLLADWFPFIPPFLDGKGWLINEPGNVGEFLVYPLNNFLIEFRLDPKFPDLRIAASAPLENLGDGTYQTVAYQARNLSFAVSPEYQIFTQTTDLVSIQVFTFPEHASMGQRALDFIEQAWDLFSDLYGNNKRNFLTMVEAEIPDGLECDGMFFLSDWYFQTADNPPTSYFDLLTVHETSHQWFYAYLSNDQANEPWLDEALATYSELLFIEALYPTHVTWWWDFRVQTYEPGGFVNTPIYAYSEDRPYINAVYLRGTSFLQDLRKIIGDKAFYHFLTQYTQTNPDQFRTREFFFTILDIFAEKEYENVLDAYFQ